MFECPILRALCERDTTDLHPRPFPAHYAYPTLRKEREGWGTRTLVLALMERFYSDRRTLVFARCKLRNLRDKGGCGQRCAVVEIGVGEVLPGITDLHWLRNLVGRN
jgi:hypothetical protein